MSRHCVTCHRCGNVRKLNIECSNCPQVFCIKCFERLISEDGQNAFQNGCIVCKAICCCARKTVYCSRVCHCYKKCPSTVVGAWKATHSGASQHHLASHYIPRSSSRSANSRKEYDVSESPPYSVSDPMDMQVNVTIDTSYKHIDNMQADLHDTTFMSAAERAFFSTSPRSHAAVSYCGSSECVQSPNVTTDSVDMDVHDNMSVSMTSPLISPQVTSPSLLDIYKMMYTASDDESPMSSGRAPYL